MLVLISIASVGIFLFTRAVAAKQQKLDASVAAVWFQRGKAQLQAHEFEKATDSFKKAVGRERENQEYLLALANALAVSGHASEAQQILLRMRDSAPENAEINLYLARLARKSSDVSGAVGYYHSALYGRWAGSQVDQERRQVRVELIQFLLDHQQSSTALPELLILGTEFPDEDEGAQTEIGKLFLRAGDPHRALEHFKLALNSGEKNSDVLAGAGEAAFRVGDYSLAQRYLERASGGLPESDRARQLLPLTKMILLGDALGPHLSSEERNRRIVADFNQSHARLLACLSQGSGHGGEGLDALNREAVAMQSRLQPSNLRRDPELVHSGMELIYRIEEATENSCGEPTGFDLALLLIGRKHESALR